MSLTFHVLSNPQRNITTDDYQVVYDDFGDKEAVIYTNDAHFLNHVNQDPVIVYDDGDLAWSGFIGEAGYDNGKYMIRAFGDRDRLKAHEDYTEWFSETGCARWEPALNSTTYSHDDSITSDQIYVTLRKGATIPRLSGYTIDWYVPPGQRDAEILHYSIEYKLPNFYKCYVQYFTYSGIDAYSNKNILSGDGVSTQTLHYMYLYLTGDTPRGPGKIRLFIRNETAGDYTVSGETDTFFVRMTNFRALSKNTDLLRRRFTQDVLSGTNVVVTPTSMEGLYPGMFAYVASPGQLFPIKSVTATSFVTDLTSNVGSGVQMFIPRMLGSTIARNVISGMFAATAIDPTQEDLLDVQFFNTSKFNAIAAVMGAQPWYVHNNIFTSPANVPTYLSDSQQTTLIHDLHNTVGAWRGIYTIGPRTYITNAYGISGYESTSFVRRRAIDYGNVPSGLMVQDLEIQRQARPKAKSAIQVKRLLNTYGGPLSPHAAIPPANVVVNAELADFFGFQFSWPLRQVTIDNGSVSYTIDELPDSIESYLAGS